MKSELTEEERAFWKEEEKKCLASPLYFYNKYWRKEGRPELTQEQWDAHVAMGELERRRVRNRERYNFTSDILDFKLLPEFLII